MSVVVGSLFLAMGWVDAGEDRTPEGIAFFETKIRPVLVSKCYKCHSANAKSPKGGLLLDTREGIRKGGESGHAVVPGSLDESLLIEAIRYEGLEMPPDAQLPDTVIADFEKWVRMEAPDPREGTAAPTRGPIDLEKGRQFWAFQPPKKTEPPAVRGDWAGTPIDRFVLARLEAAGLAPVADADRRTLIRRATFDLLGLPPTPAEVEAFVADDSGEAFDKVIDRLLDHPQFGERWGRHWLDVARYAESTGMERNVTYPYAWRYRDYVVRSFAQDEPFDRFVMEQIAGDLLEAESEAHFDAQRVATGFLALGPKGLNERNAEKYRMEVVDDQIDSTCRAILALTVGCARCHDHKFDPIPTQDYYALAGVFRSTTTLAGVRSGNAKDGNVGSLMPLGRDGVDRVRAQQDHQRQLAALESQLKRGNGSAKQGKKAKKGKGSDGPDAEPAGPGEATVQLAGLQEQVRTLRANAPPPPELAMGVLDERSPSNSRIHIRGEVDELGPEVPRGFVRVVLGDRTPSVGPAGSGRLELARWLASPDNPLTARVMVNRIWHHLFGAGLVRTVDNFGALGERPSHPELLDYLAVRFVENGWSVKRMIREIMRTRVYQLSSEHQARKFEVDPENQLLWRMSRRRLDAEAIRDAVLAASGRLALAPPAGSVVTQVGSGEIGRNLDPSRFGAASEHRSIYLPLLRGIVPDMLRVFDVADPSLVVGQRDVTTVATQALYMMNSEFMARQSEHAARRLLSQAGDDGARVDLAYELALGRPPSSAERARMTEFVAAAGSLSGAPKGPANQRVVEAWAALCQAIFASAEFRTLY